MCPSTIPQKVLLVSEHVLIGKKCFEALLFLEDKKKKNLRMRQSFAFPIGYKEKANFERVGRGGRKTKSELVFEGHFTHLRASISIFAILPVNVVSSTLACEAEPMLTPPA